MDLVSRSRREALLGHDRNAVRHVRGLGRRGGATAALSLSRDDAERVDREAERNADGAGRMSAARWRNIPPASARTFEFELLPKGPDFDKLVWKALSDIPFGETTSYGAVARTIGHPRRRGRSAPPMAPIRSP